MLLVHKAMYTKLDKHVAFERRLIKLKMDVSTILFSVCRADNSPAKREVNLEKDGLEGVTDL